jgi:pimeloyl-ACP methyl ester carboxylesterase
VIAVRSAMVVMTLAMAGALGGCSTLLAVRGQQERADRNAIISGTVTTAYEARGPLIVGLVARDASGYVLVDHFVAEKPGRWVFAVEPGTYWLAAFEDVDRDGRYDDEPALRGDPERPLTLAPGERRLDIALRIPREGRLARGPFSLSELEARSPGEQQRRSVFALSVAGDVTTLDDERFDQAVATTGMWQYYDFLLTARAGIYFLEPYDAKKIPVLFVHGIGGTPRDFRLLIDSLDRKRFQPWVFYYPSGARLDAIATVLMQLFVRLRQRYGFERAAVIAHSMGGLVTREFVLQDYESNATEVVRTYVTISSPLGGMPMAGKGIERSPVVIRSWYGLAPDSAYLNGLFFKDAAHDVRRRLPDHIAYHMLFGFGGGGPSGSGDGVVPMSSQLRPEAQDEARSERGFDETHRGILQSRAAAAWVNAILAEMR